VVVLLMCGLVVVVLGAFGGAAQAVGSAAQAPAGQRPEAAAGSEADPVHARVRQAHVLDQRQGDVRDVGRVRSGPGARRGAAEEV